MTTQEKITHPFIPSTRIETRMMQGAGVALLLMTLFLGGVHKVNPQWGEFWMVRPLVVVSLAGGIGGVFYYFMDFLRYKGGWKRFIAQVISVLVYMILLWLGTVLGLNGTLWN